MRIDLKPGRYVVAVSGGVDSVVLFDLLAKKYPLSVVSDQLPVMADNRQPTPNDHMRFVIAHYDHGIRKDSADDRVFVEDLAKKHDLKFYYEEGDLGDGASEELARNKRYDFLRRVQKETGSMAIITAHHQDDLLETAIFNLLRGTGRRGLSPLTSNEGIVRPLLEYSKAEIEEFARDKNLSWREDPTNLDLRYSRNHIRHAVLTKFTAEQKHRLISIIKSQREFNHQIDEMLQPIAGGRNTG